jgi:hypothetical protein
MSGTAELSDTLLALFYPGPLAKARLRRLGLEKHGFSVRPLLQETLPREVTAIDYAAVLFERCDLATADVSAIVSYCAAGAIACELSPMCARASGRFPKIVRINPEVPTLDSLVRTVEAALRRPLPKSGTEVTPNLLTLELFEEMERELAAGYLETLGCSSSLADKLSRMQVDWVVHLVAAGTSSGGSEIADELHITAADHACDAGCTARHLVVCENSGDLFSAPTVVEAIRLAAKHR